MILKLFNPLYQSSKRQANNSKHLILMVQKNCFHLIYSDVLTGAFMCLFGLLWQFYHWSPYSIADILIPNISQFHLMQVLSWRFPSFNSCKLWKSNLLIVYEVINCFNGHAVEWMSELRQHFNLSFSEM